MLTNIEAKALLDEEKIITANVRWVSSGGKHTTTFSLETTVLVPSQNIGLRFVGHKGKRNRSFALLYGGYPLKMITVHHSHRNPDGKIIRQPHKHFWNEANEDREVFVPDDIHFGDINQEFHDFLKQCKIKLLGTYSSIMP